jgi:hypothetical protein
MFQNLAQFRGGSEETSPKSVHQGEAGFPASLVHSYWVLSISTLGFGLELHFHQETFTYEARNVKHRVSRGHRAHYLRVSTSSALPIGSRYEVDPCSDHVVQSAAERLHCGNRPLEGDQRLPVRVATVEGTTVVCGRSGAAHFDAAEAAHRP